MRKIKMIISDMDGTLVNYPNKPFNSTWDVFPEILSEQNKKEWFRLRDFYLKKRGHYDEWFNKQLNLLNGISVEKAHRAFFPIPYSKGVESFFNSLDGKYIKGIVSSGVGFVAEKIKNDLNFNFQSSSDLEIEAEKFTGRGKINFDIYKKDKAIFSIAQKYKINLEEICYIGDHFNDVPAWEAAGLSVAFNPNGN
ncbi:haloacid dehalogenase-like hydrolase [Candidatus Pacearchaeota archaeon]|nr:haloacid dehalogenase-like hydrolase [Candidatus Pacearchaeota archaeon]